MNEFIEKIISINEPKTLLFLCGVFIFADVLTGYLKAFKNKKINLSISRNSYIKKNSSTVLVAPLTKLERKKFSFPAHVFIEATGYLKCDSVIPLEHIREIDKIN